MAGGFRRKKVMEMQFESYEWRSIFRRCDFPIENGINNIYVVDAMTHDTQTRSAPMKIHQNIIDLLLSLAFHFILLGIKIAMNFDVGRTIARANT